MKRILTKIITNLSSRFLRFSLATITITLTLALFPSVAFAAEIVVDTTGDTIASDGGCTLREAIINANDDDDTFTDCSASGTYGDDIITFAASGTITLNPSHADDDIVVSDNLTINGLSTNSTIIDGGWDGSSTETGRVFIVYHDVNAITVELNNLTIQNGHAEAANGGGIWNRGETLRINKCIIANNNAGVGTTNNNYGGGIYNEGGMLNIKESTFSNNYAGHRGGGIANENDGVLTVNNSYFEQNTSQWGAAINFFSGTGGTLTFSSISNSTFTRNTAGTRGGGINVYDMDNSDIDIDVTVTNSTFSNNTGANGAGLASNDSLTIVNSTIAYNNTTGATGSIYRELGTLTISNSIIAYEQTTNNCFSTIIDGGYNLEDVDDCGFSGTSITNTDPLLDPLADNGGPIQTHALQPTSPAIDMVLNGTSADGIDQRGAARDFDGDASGDSGTEGDIGAYEYRAPDQQCSIAVDTLYTFDSVQIYVPSSGLGVGTIDCITVDEAGSAHLAATGTDFESNYWYITATNSSGDPASGYTLNLTLPHGSLTSPQICRYPGNNGGYGWDCVDPTSSDASNATLNSVTELSDWAMADGVGPTVISLASFKGQSNQAVFGLVASLLALGSLFTLRYIKKREN